MQVFIFVLEVIGVIAFSISGAILGIKKNFDIFGIVMLGIITSVGGGVMRDIILGSTPPVVFTNPVYCIIAVVSALLFCVPYVRRVFNYNKTINNIMMIVMDSAGLASFTVTGVIYTYGFNAENVFLMVFNGVITGIGGGLLRDIISQEPPYVFTRHIYACASILGAAVCALMIRLINVETAVVSSMVVILAIRFVSAYYRINLPHVQSYDTVEENKK